MAKRTLTLAQKYDVEVALALHDALDGHAVIIVVVECAERQEVTSIDPPALVERDAGSVPCEGIVEVPGDRLRQVCGGLRIVETAVDVERRQVAKPLRMDMSPRPENKHVAV